MTDEVQNQAAQAQSAQSESAPVSTSSGGADAAGVQSAAPVATAAPVQTAAPADTGAVLSPVPAPGAGDAVQLQSPDASGDRASAVDRPATSIADPAPLTPQPDAAAAPVVAAQTAAPEVPAGETLTEKVENAGEEVALDAAAGVIHAHGMVSTWLQRVEAGLHVPLDELRALKNRLEKWL